MLHTFSELGDDALSAACEEIDDLQEQIGALLEGKGVQANLLRTYIRENQALKTRLHDLRLTLKGIIDQVQDEINTEEHAELQ